MRGKPPRLLCVLKLQTADAGISMMSLKLGRKTRKQVLERRGHLLEIAAQRQVVREAFELMYYLERACEIQIAALAGKGPGAAAQLQRPTLSLAAPLKLPSSLPAQLLGQRPDVVASRWQVAAEARGIDVAHAGFYPNVDLVGSLGYMATGGGALEFLTGKKLNYSIGPAISLPIFDGGRLRSELGSASAGYDLAVARYNQTLINALKGISDQLIRRESMDKQQDFAAESVAAAQKTYDIAMIAYQRGLTDYLNVLNAQTLLFKQQQVQQQVQAARLSAHAELVTALGGGLGAGDDVPADSKVQAPKTPAILSALDH